MKGPRFHVRRTSPVDEPHANAWRAGAPWPVPGYLVLSADVPGYRIEIEVAEEEDTVTPVGVTVRRLARLEKQPDSGEASDELLDFLSRRHTALNDGRFLFVETPRPLSSRDVRRMPLATLIEAAVALGNSWRELGLGEPSAEGREWPSDEDWRRLRRARVPRGRPQRGDGASFYRGLAKAHRALVAQGKKPSIEIARANDVSPVTARQWIFRARQLGFLEPVPKGRKK